MVGVCRFNVECVSGLGCCMSSTCRVYVDYQVLESGSDAPYPSNLCTYGRSSGADATGSMSNICRIYVESMSNICRTSSVIPLGAPVMCPYCGHRIKNYTNVRLVVCWHCTNHHFPLARMRRLCRSQTPLCAHMVRESDLDAPSPSDLCTCGRSSGSVTTLRASESGVAFHLDMHRLAASAASRLSRISAIWSMSL